MCGIGGFVDFDRDARRGGPVLSAMDRRLRPRGPDASGTYTDPDAALVHRRLIVIDPEGGAQPMLSPDGNTVLVYNGELYNTDEVRDSAHRPRPCFPQPLGYRGRAARLSRMGYGRLRAARRHFCLRALGRRPSGGSSSCATVWASSRCSAVRRAAVLCSARPSTPCSATRRPSRCSMRTVCAPCCCSALRGRPKAASPRHILALPGALRC